MQAAARRSSIWMSASDCSSWAADMLLPALPTSPAGHAGRGRAQAAGWALAAGGLGLSGEVDGAAAAPRGPQAADGAVIVDPALGAGSAPCGRRRRRAGRGWVPRDERWDEWRELLSPQGETWPAPGCALQLALAGGGQGPAREGNGRQVLGPGERKARAPRRGSAQCSERARFQAALWLHMRLYAAPRIPVN